MLVPCLRRPTLDAAERDTSINGWLTHFTMFSTDILIKLTTCIMVRTQTNISYACILTLFTHLFPRRFNTYSLVDISNIQSFTLKAVNTQIESFALFSNSHFLKTTAITFCKILAFIQCNSDPKKHCWKPLLIQNF